MSASLCSKRFFRPTLLFMIAFRHLIHLEVVDVVMVEVKVVEVQVEEVVVEVAEVEEVVVEVEVMVVEAELTRAALCPISSRF